MYLHPVLSVQRVSVCFDLSSVGAELREVSGKVQRIKSSLQHCLSAAALLPQLFLPQLSVLEDE